MAMRQTPRSGGAGTPRRPPRSPGSVHTVYEDFKPTIEWQEDEESNTLLLIYLPGFQRENLKVSTEGKNILRARGEAQFSGNKWSRFQEDYPLPEDCNVRGIRAKFEAGVLTIIIPKKGELPKEHPYIEATKPATVPSQQKPQENLQRQPQQPAAVAPKTQPNAGSNFMASPTGIPSAKKARTTAGITQETPDVDQKMPSTEKEGPKKSSKEKQEESDNKIEAIEKTTDKWNDQNVTKAHDGADKQSILLIKKPEQKMKDIQKSEQESDYHQRTTDAQEIKRAQDVKDMSRETKMKQKLEKKYEGEIMEQKERKTTITPAGAASSSRDYKQAVKNFLDWNEERQLLLNVGAAALVIMAFGAYLSYTMCFKKEEMF